MGKRELKRRRLQKTAIGDMRDRIELFTRAVTPPVDGSATAEETYTLIDKACAKVETVTTFNAGRHAFSDVNVAPNEQPTHVFTIRFRSDVTAEAIVQYAGDNYEIKRTSDPDKRRQYLQLFTRIKGGSTVPANQ